MFLKRSQPRLRRWELALLLGLAAALLLGLWLEREHSALSDSVLRLHVLANSDGEADQALKLKVRDRVLEEAAELLGDETSVEDAAARLGENLDRLAAAGAEVVAQEGYDYPVRASLEETWFPTKEYEDFSLPAGQYQALRVVIGEGAGQNWWCVVFPPLCLGSVSESTRQTALDAGMEEKQVALLTGESEGYVVKFKALELWEQLKAALT
jgi:stage II sporulation protein R